jgi:competence protein ComEC
VRAVRTGDTLRTGPVVRVAWPPDSVPSESDNRGALVLVAGSASARALLTADVDSLVEARLAPEVAALAPLALLKVAHHGSGSSTSASLLAALRARRAAISCGRRNAFGHPHPGVLARLAQAGVAVDRTDLAGSLWYEFGPEGLARVAWNAAPGAFRVGISGRTAVAQGSRARTAAIHAGIPSSAIAAAPRRW